MKATIKALAAVCMGALVSLAAMANDVFSDAAIWHRGLALLRVPSGCIELKLATWSMTAYSASGFARERILCGKKRFARLDVACSAA